ncbi:MAG: hypothetical protein KDA69_19440 [Planctomycetaceae bacterium]|nr:hypothetical protein [Planctomycetaceae bacterium]MCA9046510.1 hypothetical protein [Planctomycetaceae bacterium]MCB9953393.1 hypothetical protein [Planctomycetaceae bacterium]
MDRIQIEEQSLRQLIRLGCEFERWLIDQAVAKGIAQPTAEVEKQSIDFADVVEHLDGADIESLLSHLRRQKEVVSESRKAG